MRELTDIDQRPAGRIRPGAIAAGVILLATGVAMLLDSSGIMDVRLGRLVPGFVLIALGSAIVLDRQSVSCRRRGGIPGIWLIGVGTWMLISQTHLFGLTFQTSWPLFIILAGLMIMLRAGR